MRRIGMLLCALAFVGGMVFLILLAPTLFAPLAWSSGGYGWGLGPWLWGGFGFPLIGLAMLVFCVLMMGGMMLHGGPFAHRAGSGLIMPQGGTNSGILEQRYSQGEITKEQFEEMKRDLGL